MSNNLIDEERDELVRCVNMHNDGTIYRQGKLFSTGQNYYLYDLGTGKVMMLDNTIYTIVSDLLNIRNKVTYENFLLNDKYSLQALKELMQIFITESIFQAYPIDKLYNSSHYEFLEDEINNNLQQIILELTEKCNLRCEYCVYQSNYKVCRDFSQKEMTRAIAKRAIDYAVQHAGDKIAVTFYGGEPLLKFNLMQWCIEYARSCFKDKELTFSITTNLTLVTEEIASYLATVPNLSVVCSLDGPRDIHDVYRKYENGMGSFDNAMKGLKILTKAFKDSKNVISFNTVYAPPYDMEKLDEILKFFNSLTWLPQGTSFVITYPNYGSVDDRKEYERLKKNHENDIEEKKDKFNPMWAWTKQIIETTKDLNAKETPVFVYNQVKSLLNIHKRFISEKPYPFYPFLGCCTPGARRLYVSTQGEFFVCERIGVSPSIGDVFNGISIEKVRKHYVDEFVEAFEDCKNCWAIRLCQMCYANIYKENSINRDLIKKLCGYKKDEIERELVLYHSVYEHTPEKLDCLNDYTIT
ncbi:MAG: radical SAM protein [Oscillospiraceae bacterium]|nr:radical SAM protein [Oscillospiraceae bacterium]